MSIELTIKALSLADEARTIRRYEKRCRRDEGKRASLHGHRVKVVRAEARATHLARAYLKGTPYRTVEERTLYLPLSVEERVYQMVRKYGDGTVDARAVARWFKAPKARTEAA